MSILRVAMISLRDCARSAPHSKHWSDSQRWSSRCGTLPRQSLARTSVRHCSHATFTLCSTHLLLSHETAAAWVGGRRLQLFACTDGPVIPIYADPMIVYTVSGPTSKDILCLHALAFLFSICLHALAFLREAARASVLRRPRPWQRLSCGRDCPMEAGSAALHVCTTVHP